ncbi:nucleoside triphosphate pyrophosphohydrolase family protein [Thermodesulfovibrio yellowstonii]|uniref:nucleoside triphosphate pyrophosphohydrolase family protein n=1 Tax=Thermodesulfovibrio yellowstonii TaxID=28262 RepID=UPI0004015B3C|nr:nucleoside triphosphate pyrophosphohydrolase family protein [Thermodesulfovibrio islandicus]
MTFKEYQHLAKQTAIYQENTNYPAWIYPALGLCDEAGEIAGKLKRIIRDNKTPDKEEIKKELGDVLWYVAAVAWEFGIDLEDVARTNIEKLFSRKERNTLHGSGDNR